jgi:hypothetical protein
VSAAFNLGTAELAAQAAGETGNDGTPGQAACAAFVSHEGTNRLSNADAWEAAAQAAIDAFLAGDSVSAGSIREALAAREPQPVPELAAAITETRALRALAAEILAAFGPSGSGHTARVGQVQIRKWRERAGLPS